MQKSLVRIEEIKISLEEDESLLREKIKRILGFENKQGFDFTLVKKAIDSRDKNNIVFVYSVNVSFPDAEKHIANRNKLSANSQTLLKKHKVRIIELYIYSIHKTNIETRHRPIVVGTGPAGLFAGLVLAKAGLSPILIERGQDVDTRSQDVELFHTQGVLNPNSNVQFGEGGAGTFSDGKLYTLVNDPRSKFIFEEMVKAGAPQEILYNAKPHVGTDRLKTVVKNLRKKIIDLGGEVRFDACLTDLDIENNHVTHIELNGKERLETADLVLAIGHSARDTYEMIYAKGLECKQKAFAMGLRIEHSAEMINQSQFGSFCSHRKLPTASYKLVHHNPTQRSVFSFCMCPGGYVVNASSEIGRLTVNGMSEYGQDSPMSNSALLVGVTPQDFESDHPLAGIAFQRKWEEKAFALGGKNYYAPAQLVGDFLEGRTSEKLGILKSTHRPGITLCKLDECLPSYIIESIKTALPALDKQIHGFAHHDAVLVGIEARSSSVVQIVRDESLQSNVRGVYPTGEGAGYAGGITSAAIDGLKVAEKVIEKYSKK